MAKLSIIPRSHADSRGIPDGFDPHMFYEYSLARHAASASGVEWMLYRIMPHSVIKSFAIAIDPFSELRMSGTRITPTNRNRSRYRLSVLETVRWIEQRRDLDLTESIPNWNNIPGVFSPYKRQSHTTIVTRPGLTGMTRVADSMSDTTRRTRVWNSELGEAVSFSYNVFSAPRTVYRVSDVTVELEKQPFAKGGNDYRRNYNRYTRIVTPTAARVISGDVTTLKSAQLARANAFIKDRTLQLYNRAMPDARQYSLFRNVVELKDLPRSLASLRGTLVDLHKFISSIPDQKLRRSILDLRNLGQNIPTEYLSYQFGWRQTYSDLMDLLTLPDRVVKRFNYLNRQAAKSRVLRARSEFTTSFAAPPISFVYDSTDSDITPTVNNDYTEKVSLSLVLGYGFDFPNLMPVDFSEKNFLRAVGAYPTPLDIYNLIPWTWMVDWFTGLDSYIEAIQRINSDRKLVNYGLVTCDITGTLVGTYHSRSENVTTVSYQDATGKKTNATSTTFSGNVHQSTAQFHTVKRQDITTSLSGLESTAEPSKLTGYRQSILAALILQFSNLTRHHKL